MNNILLCCVLIFDRNQQIRLIFMYRNVNSNGNEISSIEMYGKCISNNCKDFNKWASFLWKMCQKKFSTDFHECTHFWFFFRSGISPTIVPYIIKCIEHFQFPLKSDSIDWLSLASPMNYYSI